MLNERLAIYESGSSRTAMSDLMAKLKDTQNENAQLKADLARMYMRDEHGIASTGTNGLDRELLRLKERLRIAERETEEKEERVQRMRSEMKSYKELYVNRTIMIVLCCIVSCRVISNERENFVNCRKNWKTLQMP